MNETSAKEAKHLAGRWGRDWWQWAISVGLIVAGVAYYFMTISRVVVGMLEVPYRPPQISAEFVDADRLPARPADLAGYNLLLVSLDTTRVDRIGSYGNTDIQTPILDGLASQGVIFSNALATAPTTLPSHASLLTGLYPLHHGARANGLSRLSNEQLTLAETLSDNGYATAAMVSTFVLDNRFGLDQGFELYDDETKRDVGPRSLRDPERRGDETSDHAIRWLRAERGRPFFLWIHYYDPHAEYAPPAPYAEQYAENPYDGEIAFVDHQIGRLLETLEELGEAEKTLVVVVADHGEGLGDHGEATHGFLVHDATIRVPLIVSAGSRMGGGIHLRRPVSQVDIMPTILSLLGIAVPEGLDGIDLTRADETDRAIFTETVQGLVAYGWAPLVAVSRGRHRYIHGPNPELYDLEDDPLEARNFHDSDHPLASSLRSRLREFLGPDLGAAMTLETEVPLDPEELARLQSLGYTVGASGDLPPPASRADTKQMLPLLMQVEKLAIVDSAYLDPEELIEKLEKIALEQPDFAPTFQHLAELYYERGEWKKSEAAIRNATRLCPNSPTLIDLLAHVLVALGETDEALSLLSRLVVEHPQYWAFHHNMGVLLLQRGRAHEAADQLVRAFDLAPSDSAVLQALIRAMTAAGRRDELETLLDSKLKQQPRLQHLRRAIADLRRGGRRPE